MTQHNTSTHARIRLIHAALIPFLLSGLFVAARGEAGESGSNSRLATIPATIINAVRVPDSLFGRSGKLLMRIFAPGKRDMQVGILKQLFGDSSFASPAVRTVKLPESSRTFSLATLVPFTAKVAGKVGTYRIGNWPSEQSAPRSSAYSNPAGFILVTKENQDTRVSENFRLRDFLTKDQATVWPKYLVLREELIDKLELTIADLKAHGVAVKKLHVMSGFRTPQYNAQGTGAGRATNSRHMYGDAADVFVDNEGRGIMSDLNRDGRVNIGDTQVILDAVSRVERRYPDLVGGSGLYKANASHGPFAHIDVRGVKATWTY